MSHKSYDYDGREVFRGLPDPFVESLVHDSIIVQIPRLRGRVNNRLEQVLSIFDQSRKDRHNHQVMNIEEDCYAGDAEMQHIVHRLLAAASDAKLRQDMNVEDEYFMAIENRDTKIMMMEEQLAAQNQQLAAQDQQLAHQQDIIRQSARKMKEAGIDIASICAMTQLSADEVERL